jgi:hypothetical protein
MNYWNSYLAWGGDKPSMKLKAGVFFDFLLPDPLDDLTTVVFFRRINSGSGCGLASKVDFLTILFRGGVSIGSKENYFYG